VVLFQICSPPDTLTEEGDTRRMEQLHLDINECAFLQLSFWRHTHTTPPTLLVAHNRLVGKINGKWSSLNFSPISYLYTELSLEEQAALYAAADMALLTPLREGMNLVYHAQPPLPTRPPVASHTYTTTLSPPPFSSHEFVLCQQDTWAPLVVSEFAGAAQRYRYHPLPLA
jgi:hypothetical protein